MTDLIVTRRFGAYEFVIRTSCSVAENVARLESYLASPPKPRGFFIADPRLTGRYDGSTFLVRPWDGPLWGSAVPTIEGYFVPTDNGSDVVVQVAQPALTRYLGLLLAVYFLALGGSALGGAEVFSTVLLLGLVLLSLLVIPPLFHGANAARTLHQLFAESPPN